jgi:HEAT repeat protein
MRGKQIGWAISLLMAMPGFAEWTEDQAVKRVHNHLLIQDAFSAVKDAQSGLIQYPDSQKLHLAYLEALCAKGEEVEAFQEFIHLSKLMGDQNEKNRTLFELLAWGVLNKGETSPLLLIRLYSVLGAAFTHDARALPILIQELKGSNAMLRSLAVKLAASYGDAPLQDELKRLLKEEKVWFVRLEVIQAIGALRMTSVRNDLKEILAHPKTMAEEKAAVIFSLIQMYDKLSPEELKTLIHSDRAGLRQLACELIAHLELYEAIPDILPLLQDASPDVRVSAMNTLGLLQIADFNGKPILEYIRKNLEDLNPEVSITAGWLATILGYEEGKTILKSWIEQEQNEPKRLASAALAVTGTKGSKLALEELKKQSDPYTRVNLAIGLIGQRKEVQLAAQMIFQAIVESDNQLWMWDDRANSLFRSLAPSSVRHIEQIPQYPQVVDQLVKLDVLSILSIVKYPRALEAVKEFLQTQSWGVTGAAAATLLEEGDESALDIVRQLLLDPEEKIRIQAALILAIVGSDSSAVKVLIEAYPKVDRDMKIHILEALGHIGDPSSVLFLAEVLKEPFQALRVVAASALIQCLYN